MNTSGAEPVDRLVLDTSAYSHLRAGHPVVLDELARAISVVMPITVLGELEAAFDLGRRPSENRQALAELLAEPFVTLWPTTASVARQYGHLFARLKKAGTPLPVNDIWIAAAVLDCHGVLLTFDRDFTRVPNLDVVILDAA